VNRMTPKRKGYDDKVTAAAALQGAVVAPAGEVETGYELLL
jgi:hypothetical protein